MKRSLLIVIGFGLGGLGSSACGEITAFCMSAGAGGVALQVTTVQTPSGTQVVCGPAPVVVDSSRQAVAPVLRDSLP